MALSPDSLGTPVKPGSATETTLYQPSSATGIISAVTACEQGGAIAAIRIGIDYSGGSSVAAAEWLVYDLVIAPNEPASFGKGWIIPDGAQLRVESDTGAVSFAAFGMEQT